MAKNDKVLENYVEVKDRIRQFHATYQDGIIQTVPIVSGPDRFFFQAKVAKTGVEFNKGLYFTGHGEEVVGTSFINKSSAAENAETSAVGRALAFMGFSVDQSVASREEVENAIARQAEYDLEREKALNALVKEMKECDPELKNSAIVSMFSDIVGLDITKAENKKNFNPSMEKKMRFELFKKHIIKETGAEVLMEKDLTPAGTITPSDVPDTTPQETKEE